MRNCEEISGTGKQKTLKWETYISICDDFVSEKSVCYSDENEAILDREIRYIHKMNEELKKADEIENSTCASINSNSYNKF